MHNSFLVYPVFVMLSQQLNSSIDASVYPQGYITDLSILREQFEHENRSDNLGIIIKGLPSTAIVIMDMEFVDMPTSGSSEFSIKTQHQNMRAQQLFFSDKSIKGIQHQCPGNAPLLLNNEMSRDKDYGELTRIRYFGRSIRSSFLKFLIFFASISCKHSAIMSCLWGGDRGCVSFK